MIRQLHGIVVQPAAATHVLVTIIKACALKRLTGLICHTYGDPFDMVHYGLRRGLAVVMQWPVTTSVVQTDGFTGVAFRSAVGGVMVDSQVELSLQPGDQIVAVVTLAATGATTEVSVDLIVDESPSIPVDMPKFPDDRAHWLAACLGLTEAQERDDDETVPRW